MHEIIKFGSFLKFALKIFLVEQKYPIRDILQQLAPKSQENLIVKSETGNHGFSATEFEV